jgi:copper homeostasis protein
MRKRVMQNPKLLEICCFTIKDALIAQQGGADRIELCSSYYEGGVTPSFGTIKLAREVIAIPIYVLIRPRPGNFIYSDLEWLSMKADIIKCKEIGVEGISIGMLTVNGEIDIIKCEELREISKGLKLTFHRAFDQIENQLIALNVLKSCGFSAIMSSGGKSCALDGMEKLSALKKLAGDEMVVIAAGGIRKGNIALLRDNNCADIFHSALFNHNSINKNMFGSESYFNLPDVSKLTAALRDKTEI